MLNRWDNASAPRDPLEQLVHQSRLVGAEESLVLWGGGNNSVKLTGTDPLGAPLDVMFVKGSGSDMKTIVAAEYPAVRLDYVRALLERESMSDEEMVEYLARCVMDPKSRRPSIETLLHAFLDAPAVLHTHADAILSVTNTRGREKTVRHCFGDGVLTIPYLRPGFKLSRVVAQALSDRSDAVAVILMNHGLITWGPTPADAYRKHLEMVSRAEEFTAKAGVVRPRAAVKTTELKSVTAEEIAPRIRGRISRERKKILEFDDSPEVLEFLDQPSLVEAVGLGAATPDHLLYTKRFPVVISTDLDEAFDRHAREYSSYFDANTHGEAADALPRVFLAPGLGMWTAGNDARAARIVRDIFRHTIRIVTAAQNLGGFATLSDRDAFDAEYWPLELYKLTLLPADRELAGHVALITGAAGAIGSAIARRFAAEGAHVIITDLRGDDAEGVAREISSREGLKRAVGLQLDVTDEREVRDGFERGIREFGGIDIVVSNAGISHVSPIDKLSREQWEKSLAVNTTAHFLVLREAIRIFKEQKLGGNVVFVATKNVTAPGKEFGAYSVAKAAEAQLCRIAAIEGGEFGIRANMINPDAVFGASGLWSDEVVTSRARAHGISADKLPDFYRQRNLLKAEVTAEDVAEGALFLASARSGKTTGAMLPVDGGLREAFPR